MYPGNLGVEYVVNIMGHDDNLLIGKITKGLDKLKITAVVLVSESDNTSE